VGYLCANFSLPGPLCSRLRPDVRDRQTARRQTSDAHHRLRRGHKNLFQKANESIVQWLIFQYTCVLALARVCLFNFHCASACYACIARYYFPIPSVRPSLCPTKLPAWHLNECSHRHNFCHSSRDIILVFFEPNRRYKIPMEIPITVALKTRRLEE